MSRASFASLGESVDVDIVARASFLESRWKNHPSGIANRPSTRVLSWSDDAADDDVERARTCIYPLAARGGRDGVDVNVGSGRWRHQRLRGHVLRAERAG